MDKGIIGLKKGTVILSKHNAMWSIIAQNTIDDLSELLGTAAIDIQHIGSTSIQNISAKPIIDIVIGLDNLEYILQDDIVEMLSKYGYYRKVENDNAEKIFFYRGNEDIITHYIHAVVYKAKAWNYYTGFRDYLNNHSDVAARYQEIKMNSAKHCNDSMDKYWQGKASFLKEINAKIAK